MRLRSRHVRYLSLCALALLLFCLLRAFIFEAPEPQPPLSWSRAANDGVLDELLDEAFTRPADRSAVSTFVIDAGHLPAGVLRFGIVEKRVSPLCPEGALEAPVSARVRAFQPLVDTGDLPSPLFFYSAYLEPELTTTSSLLNVRILALMERGFHASLFCQLWFRQGPRPLSLLPVRHIVLTEPPADRKSPSLLEAVELHCTETDVQPSDPTPYAVSIVSAAHLCDSPVNVLPVLLTGPATSTIPSAPAAPPLPPPSATPAGLAVCCSTPLHDAVDPSWFIEWLEAQRLFGATRVFIYLLKDRLHSPTPALYRVLRAYTQHKGLVTALDWPLPPSDVFANVWPDGGTHASIFSRWGRILAANDCLRRISTASSPLFRYAVIADLNEVLVPGQRFNDWAGLFLRSPQGPAAFALCSARVQPASNEEREALGGSGLNLTVRQRAAHVTKPGADANLVLDPARVASFGADGTVRLREQQHPQETVSLLEDEALVFNYDMNGARMNEADLVLDERLAQFSYRLANAVTLTKEALRRN